ncbi:MAG: hypothetical protein HY200_04115 [Nitrospirae bacterium]|nr:hypothetical protein [Nitrospirota bacterium]MBI3594119.1 hypothetical protein [Nitrospirota bacterium]
MWVFKVFGMLVILLEGVLLLAFWGGAVWIGGWKGGMILLSAVLMILILPWIGHLEVEFDLIKGSANIKLGWFARIIVGDGPDRESRFRFLFFRWRRHTESRKRSKIGKVKNKSVLNLNPESLSRGVLALLQGMNELIWEADEISLKIQAPTQIDLVDQVLARVFGKRLYGPLFLSVSDEGEREILIRFRIGLLKGFLIGLYALIQGRPRQMWRSVKV